MRQRPKRLLKRSPKTSWFQSKLVIGVGILLLVIIIVKLFIVGKEEGGGTEDGLLSWLPRGVDGRIVLEGHRLPAFAEEVLGGLPSDEPFTFFSPTDRAIDNLHHQLQEKVDPEEAQDLLSEVLLHHVVPGRRVGLRDVPQHGSGLRLKTVSAAFILLVRHKDTLRVDNTRVNTLDLNLGQGVVHLIDRPLIPASVKRKLSGGEDGEAKGSGEGGNQEGVVSGEIETEDEDGQGSRRGSRGEGEEEEQAEERGEQVGELQEEGPDSLATKVAVAEAQAELQAKERTAAQRRRKKSEKARLQDEAAAQLQRERKRAEEEEARKALEGLNELLKRKQAEQMGRMNKRANQGKKKTGLGGSTKRDEEEKEGDREEEEEEEKVEKVETEEMEMNLEDAEIEEEDPEEEEEGGGQTTSIKKTPPETSQVSLEVEGESGEEKENTEKEVEGEQVGIFGVAESQASRQIGSLIGGHEGSEEADIGGGEGGDDVAEVLAETEVDNTVLIVHKLYGDAANELLAKDQQAPACNSHGALESVDLGGNAGNGGKRECVCAAFYTGDKCQIARPVPGSPSFRGFNDSIVFSRLRLSREALNLADSVSIPVRIHTPAETLTLIEELTASKFKSLWADLPKNPSLGPPPLYSTCALVGSSGVMLRAERGDEIDAHEMVMRLERAPTRGYEAHVGTSTSFRLLPADSAGFHEGHERILFVLHSRDAFNDLMAFKKRFPDEQINFLSPEFISYAAATAGALPSLEYLAINIALQVCKKVSLYGFFAAERQGARFHYYDYQKPPSSTDAGGLPSGSSSFSSSTSSALAVGGSVAEWAQTAALLASGLLKSQDACLGECRQTLAKCSRCLGVSVPDLFQMNELTPDQIRANKERESRWTQFVETRKAEQRKAARKAAAQAEAEKDPHAHKMAMKQKEKERERLKHQIVEDNEDTIDMTVGWEYLIETGQFEELPESQLREYFTKYSVEDVPGTKLEMIMQIRKHNKESKRGAWKPKLPV